MFHLFKDRVASPRAGDSLKMSANIAMYNDSTTPLPFKFLMHGIFLFVCLQFLDYIYVFSRIYEYVLSWSEDLHLIWLLILRF